MTKKIFHFIDKLLNNPTEYRYIILLADSGMGKTAFMLNSYGRHLQQHKKKFELELLPMGIADVDARIGEIPNPSNTVLFLDAFDEDILAVANHRQRLETILKLTERFKKVIISCRTQFFPKDEEIPDETGILKVGPRGMGEKAQYTFHKVYLSPFSDKQVKAYLHQRYPFWRLSLRKKAWKVVEKAPSLMVRPMLLTYIEYLIAPKSKKAIHYTFELYEEMVDAG